jgi:hypothetical protein
MQTSGSKRVAQYANRHLKRFLFESPAFQAGRYEDAVREAISKEESSLLESFRDGDHEFAVSGSTVSLAIVNLTKGILVAGNLGDSSILMGQYGRCWSCLMTSGSGRAGCSGTVRGGCSTLLARLKCICSCHFAKCSSMRLARSSMRLSIWDSRSNTS